MQKKITRESAAMRLARTIASDILVYNREKAAAGVAADDLFERLADEIKEGHAHFESRVSPELLNQHNFFERALVDVLLHRAIEHGNSV